ncbi:uncharacterized protein [Montipora foliosa]|uniref:uncharacterized protein n=1 Tax=Montipora foliosa TaxID=591990 RepID=UPI0035F1E39D
MEETDKDESEISDSNRDISSSSADQLGSATQKRSRKRRKFLVASIDRTLDPNLSLENSSSNGEDLPITKGRVRTTAIVSDRDADEDSASSSSDNQVVRITPKKRIRSRRRRKCIPAGNTSSDDDGEFYETGRKQIRRRGNLAQRFNETNSATDLESSPRIRVKRIDFNEKDESSFLELCNQSSDPLSPSGCGSDNEDRCAVHTDGDQISDSEGSIKGTDKDSHTGENQLDHSDLSDDFLSEISGHDNITTSDADSHRVFFSDGDVSEGDQPVCDGTNIKRRTFEATFLALSNKHHFSKSTRTDILKFLEMIIPTPNLPTSNYTFEKKLMGEMNINLSKTELCLCCNETINDGKCQNEKCEKFNNKLNYHEIEICYFIPLKDQLQRVLTEHWDKEIDYKQDHAHGHGFYYDICCGEVYQNTPGKDDPQKQISLVYHIDGAPAVKSKSMNLWPIQCFVN